MAKTLRRMMALTIVLSMMTGVLSIPAGAEGSAAQADVTVDVTVTSTTSQQDITNENGDVIGQEIISITTDTSDSQNVFSQETTTDTSWTTQETDQQSGQTEQSGNTTTESSGAVVTDVTGSETRTDSIHSNKDTGVQTYSGSVNGQEDTTITDTSTTVTTSTGVVLVDSTQGPTTTIDNQVQEGSWSTMTSDGTSGWVKTDTNDQDFELVPETEKTGKTTETPIEVGTDPLTDNDVTLTMTQTNNEASAELFITIEEALASNLQYTPGVDQPILDSNGQQTGTRTVTEVRNDANEVIGYTIIDKTITSQTTGQIEPGTAGSIVADGEEIKTYIQPKGYTAGTEEILNAEGNVIGTRTTTEIRDAAGNVIGYTITEEVISSSGAAETTANLPAPAETFELPAKPEAPAPVTVNGLTTTVTVTEELDANGKVIGYKTTKTVTDESNNLVSTESETIYGTSTSYSSTLKTTPTSDEIVTTTVTTVYGNLTTQKYTQTTSGTRTDTATQDVSKSLYQLVNTENGLFFLYEGKMYEVTAITSDEAGVPSQGETQMTTLVPDLANLMPSGGHGSINSNTDLRVPESFTVSSGIADGYELQYVGYGLESRIKVDYGSGSTLAHQFILQDEHGNKHYVYCADFSVTAKRGTSYNMDNVVNSGYFTDEQTARKVETIAINGYWGTTSGTGSLAHVKTVLHNAKQAGLISLSDEEIENITPGEALTATQAALWYYGDSSGQTSMGADVTGSVYTANGSRNPYSSESSTVNALYKALINLDPATASNNTTELLNETNFATETTLVIKEKATDASGNVKTHTVNNQTHELYVTDLTFTVDVKKNDLTGNLVVTITDEYGNALHDPIQIATENSNLLGQFVADATTASTNILLEDLELPEGVKFNLNLHGTQNLAQGAYLYSAEVYSTSQTFIGVASGKQDVNLNVQMEFSVTDPEAKVQRTTTTWQEQEVDSESYTKVDRFKQEKLGTTTSQTVTVDTQVVGTTVQTDVTRQTTDKHREWERAYCYDLVTVNDEDGGGGGGDLTTIVDEDVPLADAPKTGDFTLALAIVSLFSAGGILILNRKRDEEAA